MIEFMDQCFQIIKKDNLVKERGTYRYQSKYSIRTTENVQQAAELEFVTPYNGAPLSFFLLFASRYPREGKKRQFLARHDERAIRAVPLHFPP